MGAVVAVLGLLFMAGGWVVVRLVGEVYPAASMRRCPGCGYEMTGTPGTRCPECGSDAGSERELHRRVDYTPHDQVRLLSQAAGILAIVVGLMMVWGGAWIAMGPA
jgi:hypothetical protein